jgi:hypothetical protein
MKHMGPPPAFVIQRTLTIIPHMALKLICIHMSRWQRSLKLHYTDENTWTSTTNLKIKIAYLLVVYLTTLSVVQIRQLRTVGSVIMNLTGWRDSGLHEVRNGHLHTRQKCYHFCQRSVNITITVFILSNNRHKRVNFSKELTNPSQFKPKTTTVLAICF